MSFSSHSDLNIDQDRTDEIRENEIFEEGDFPAIKPNYDRQEHTHNTVTRDNAPQKNP